MNDVFVVTYKDPTYLSQRTMGVFGTPYAANDARAQWEDALTDEEKDRAVYFIITVFELNKVYVL